jgi:BirA family biotin operon repressor/biotin-[acetyl-CoA-carboxylase] ligase
LLSYLKSEGDFPRTVLNCLVPHQAVQLDSLCEHLQTAASEVLAAIAWLQNSGVWIDAVREPPSYILKSELALCDAQALMTATSMPVFYRQSTASTNTDLKEMAPSLSGHALYVSEYQTKGRGRRLGRGWQGHLGQQMSFSILNRTAIQPRNCSGLSLWAGLMVVQALEKLGFNGVALKWPNDLYFKQAKLGGILIEMQPAPNPELTDLVIGIGMNMQSASSLDVRDRAVASLADVNQEVDYQKHEIIAACWRELAQGIRFFIADGLQPYLAQWHARDMLLNQRVQVHTRHGVQEGFYQGVDAQGRILVEHQQGLATYMDAEVSLRSLSNFD